ncbi:MAG: hypothetical protein J7L21_02985 [Sulfurimonas sp.]|nr:hypothetical protein [Sulfurimonas sp.]
MFFSFFSSKNQKLVKQWSEDHEQIVVLAHKVIAGYSTHNLKVAKKELIKLNNLTVRHLMEEDIGLYRLLKDDKRVDSETKKLADDFRRSFQGIKMVLMDFLTKYTDKEAILDEDFFKTFNELVGVLGERISFEEDNLYNKLNAK